MIEEPIKPTPPPMQIVQRGYVPGWAVGPLTIGTWLAVVLFLFSGWIGR